MKGFVLEICGRDCFILYLEDYYYYYVEEYFL